MDPVLVRPGPGGDGPPAGVDLETAKRSTVSRIIDRLRDYIQARGIREGSKLPPERVLASELGVSRPTLREAIKALTILDALESRRGDGTYVRSAARLTREWPAIVEVEDKPFSMLELLEVRKMFEPGGARLATARASEADLTRRWRNCAGKSSASPWTTIGWRVSTSSCTGRSCRLPGTRS